jgi:DNA-binding LacI/PurR family transcriptional regulator
MNSPKRVTIKEVARLAGVSVQTVSRVINDRPDVAPDTRQRVQQLIDELGYQPSALARSLIQQRSYTLGVVTAGLKYIGPSRTLNGIISEAESSGYSLLLKELASYKSITAEPLLEALLSYHVDGIIWAVPEIGDNHEWLKELLPDIPVPLAFLTMPAQPNLLTVSFNNYAGGRLATHHLLEQGYRRIGHITGPLDWWESRQRKDGWRDALLSAGIEPLDKHWAEGNWSSASGEQAFLRLLESYPGMDAVFVGNDQMALAVLQLSCKHGLSIPRDLGVVGFDGLDETPYYWPPLTTIFQNQHNLGCTAVEEILQVIEMRYSGEPLPPPRAIVLEPELFLRASSQKSSTILRS